MTASYRANQDLTLYPEFTDDLGAPIVPVAATFTVHDRTGEIAAAQPVDLFSYAKPELIVQAQYNALADGETMAWRRIQITVDDEKGKTYQNEIVYYLKEGLGLIAGRNSFANLLDLNVVAADMIHLKMFQLASEEEQASALIQAWNNLGQLPVQFDDLKGTDSYDKGSTRELIDADLSRLAPKTYQRLLRAQVIEADYILGGNPIEARRRTGLISDSAGESAHFFRTSKPLNLPCCRAAIDELRGIVNWSVRLGRC